jgi:hypothetical protein
MIGKNWDKPFTFEEFQDVWHGHIDPVKGSFQDYHDLDLDWGETHQLLGEPKSQSGWKTAWPKYQEFCLLQNSPLMEALS